MNQRERYERYLRSVQWKAKRKQVLERDRYQCQTCLSSESLEVHHKTYKSFGNEPLEHLITLCHDCHEAITAVFRRRRYGLIELSAEECDRAVEPLKTQRKQNAANLEVSNHRRVAPTPAQWTNVRSSQPLLKNDEADFEQAGKD
ncbi:MAG: HNH endonuclease [Leptolyngbya sp. SIO1D8]|nr:HNH endonuclease [Leptolyngbya sp. SIO1D8]